eukprot:2944460-Rhodomonas_salina.1
MSTTENVREGLLEPAQVGAVPLPTLSGSRDGEGREQDPRKQRLGRTDGAQQRRFCRDLEEESEIRKRSSAMARSSSLSNK